MYYEQKLVLRQYNTSFKFVMSKSFSITALNKKWSFRLICVEELVWGSSWLYWEKLFPKRLQWIYMTMFNK